jgi:hypothetical protein
MHGIARHMSMPVSVQILCLLFLFENHDNMSSNRCFKEEMEDITINKKSTSKIMEIYAALEFKLINQSNLKIINDEI